MKFHCWDRWFDIIATFRKNIIGMAKANIINLSVLESFITTVIEIMEETWVNEVTLVGTSKLDLLIQDYIRGVHQDSMEDYVVKYLSEEFQTHISRAAIEEANYLLFINDKLKAENIIRGRLGYFKGLLDYINQEENIYLWLVVNNEIDCFEKGLINIINN